MRCLIIAALALQAAPQEARFSFEVEQGWTLAPWEESAYPRAHEAALQDGFAPTFRPTAPMPVYPSPDRSAPRVVLRDRSGSTIPDSTPRPPGVARKDPIRIEGTLTLPGDGTQRLDFRRIEYWDRTQRYWIEFDGAKVRTVGLGRVEKWSGDRDAWAARLGKLEESFLEAYLKLTTPQPAARAAGLGLPAGEPDGNRLFVISSVEEQFTALLLARIDGAALAPGAWPRGVERYPERVVRLARQVTDRLRAQSENRLAPQVARAGRALRDEPWTGAELAVPTFDWSDDAVWIRGLNAPVAAARARLAKLADGSRDLGMSVDVWRDSVVAEARALRKALVVREDGGPLEARRLPVRGASYDWAEKRDGAIHRAEVAAVFPEIEVVHFRSGDNVWRCARIRLETWLKSELKKL